MAKAPDLGEGRNLSEDDLKVIVVIHDFSLKIKYAHLTGPSSSVGDTQKPL